MHKSRMILAAGTLVLSGLASAVWAQNAYQTPEYVTLLKELPKAKHTLAEGIKQVAVGTEVPIESKLEFEDGKLWLSVYTSAKGLGAAAEDNSFKEYKGDATEAAWKPETEVFKDLKHIARSAQYHTLLSMTSLTIPQIIDKATAAGQKPVFSVKEKVRNGKPVFEVLSVDGSGVKAGFYDLVTGNPM